MLYCLFLLLHCRGQYKQNYFKPCVGMWACSCVFTRFIQLVVVSEQLHMDWREFRKKGVSYPQLSVKPCRLPGSQLPTCLGTGDDAPITKDGRKTLYINRVSIKDFVIQVADEVLRSGKGHQFGGDTDIM